MVRETISPRTGWRFLISAAVGDVLYPWQGTDILCRGASVPYYEFLHDGRLTDTEWKSMLDGDARPDLPSWYKPITEATGGR